MSIRTLATLAVAIVLGLIAVIILNNYLSASKKAQVQQVAGGGLAPVVVAAQPIARGTTLQQPLLKVVSYPQASVPVGAYRSIQDLTGAKTTQRLALHSIVANEPILDNELTNNLNLSSVLTPGMQAIAIKDTDVAGVGGFVLPGDRVDVMLTRSVSGGANGKTNTVTQILAENVRVMGVDQSDNDEATKPTVAKAVTVEVTPVQAQAIALGEQVGTIAFALRHVADDMPLAKHATTVAELGFQPPPERPAAPAGAGPGGVAAVPLYGPNIVRVTRSTDTTGYRLGQ